MYNENCEINSKLIIKRKHEKAEDFIGWVSNDGNLEVIGMTDYRKFSNTALFKVVCKICSPDIELYPEGYFISTKQNLKEGLKPCGCGVAARTPIQYLILARRAGEGRFIVHGFDKSFTNCRDTKLNLECLKDKYNWSSTIDSVVNKGIGCPKCAGNARPTEQEALAKCKAICDEMDYEVVGFVSGYIGSNKTRFEYICPIHGLQNVSYSNFVNQRRKCPGCAKTGYDPNKPGSFYIVKWTKDGHSFIKFGITNQKVSSRIKQQSNKTKHKYEILFQQIWEDGNVANNIEKSIKQDNLLEIGIVDKLDFSDGFTETIDLMYFNVIINHIKSFL